MPRVTEIDAKACLPSQVGTNLRLTGLSLDADPAFGPEGEAVSCDDVVAGPDLSGLGVVVLLLLPEEAEGVAELDDTELDVPGAVTLVGGDDALPRAERVHGTRPAPLTGLVPLTGLPRLLAAATTGASEDLADLVVDTGGDVLPDGGHPARKRPHEDDGDDDDARVYRRACTRFSPTHPRDRPVQNCPTHDRLLLPNNVDT